MAVSLLECILGMLGRCLNVMYYIFSSTGLTFALLNFAQTALKTIGDHPRRTLWIRNESIKHQLALKEYKGNNQFNLTLKWCDNFINLHEMIFKKEVVRVCICNKYTF